MTVTRLKGDGEPFANDNGRTFVIPKGYERVLGGLRADVKRAAKDNSGITLFRASYAQAVLDQFAAELRSTKKPSDELGKGWRSIVLNPLLQRQLHGYPDNEAPMLGKHFEGLEGADLETAVNAFYLSRDPLAPEEQPALRRGILYITEARWFLGAGAQIREDDAHYESCKRNTDELYDRLAESGDDSQDGGLQEFELVTISGEFLEKYYKQDAVDAVSGGIYQLVLFS